MISESILLQVLAYTAFAAGALVVITYVPAVIVKNVQKRRLARLCRGRLVLSYDDGPDPSLTPKLLELLQRHQAKASFYLLGFRAERSSAISDQLAKSGNHLGCHSHWHLNCWRISPWRAVKDVRQGYEALGRWIPANAAYRPPFGKLTTWTWLATLWRGAPLHWWTFDGCDTHPQLPDYGEVAQRAIATGGAVVLMHNHDRGPDRERYVLALTEELLIAGRRAGLEICTMEQLGALRQM